MFYVWYAIISCELGLEIGGKIQNGENLAGYGASKTISFVQGLKGAGFEIIFWYDASKTMSYVLGQDSNWRKSCLVCCLLDYQLCAGVDIRGHGSNWGQYCLVCWGQSCLVCCL